MACDNKSCVMTTTVLGWTRILIHKGQKKSFRIALLEVCPTFQPYTDLALWYVAGSPKGKLERRPVVRFHTLSSSEVRGDWLAYVSIRQHTSAYVSIRQHTSAYVSIRQHTSAYAFQHTSAYVSIRISATGADAGTPRYWPISCSVLRLTYADVCRICWRMLTYAPKCGNATLLTNRWHGVLRLSFFCTSRQAELEFSLLSAFRASRSGLRAPACSWTACAQASSFKASTSKLLSSLPCFSLCLKLLSSLPYAHGIIATRDEQKVGFDTRVKETCFKTFLYVHHCKYTNSLQHE